MNNNSKHNNIKIFLYVKNMFKMYIIEKLRENSFIQLYDKEEKIWLKNIYIKKNLKKTLLIIKNDEIFEYIQKTIYLQAHFSSESCPPTEQLA